MARNVELGSSFVLGAMLTGSVFLSHAFLQAPGANWFPNVPDSARGVADSPTLPQEATTQTSRALLGLTAVGLALLSARPFVNRGHKAARAQQSAVARNFFGGDSTPAVKRFDVTTELGVQEPVGFWDPLGLAADGDEATFKRRRATEIKHGRVSMYATMGYITPYYFKFPGYLSPSQDLKFADVPNGLAAISKVPAYGWAQILLFIATIETTGFFTGSPDPEVPGDYGVGFPNFIGKVDDPEAKTTKLAAELANGRLAMVAIIGMFFQDGLTGSAWGDWALYTDSPLRFDATQELGVQEPVGFWDPLGLSADGDEATFKRRRAVELKHGRISMYATMGYITPYYFKFPGYLSPSADLKFADIPNGLAAVSKVPTLGWLQIIWFIGLIETTGFFTGVKKIDFQQDATQESDEPGNYGVGFPTFLGTVDDAETRRTKLAAELANGRLAMVAIIGMFFQDGLTGSAWGDWALYTDSPLR